MEPSTEEKKPSGPSTRTVIMIAAIVIAIVIAIAAAVVLRGGDRKSDGPAIGYSAEARVMLDQDSLQAAMDRAIENAKGKNVSLKYKNNAYSTDGVNFDCYIVNSASNLYDMFLTIYADAELADQIFLSELVPPGSGFESITLDHALDAGDHTVYVGLTQVQTDEETGEQTLVAQVWHTMDFHVTE